MGSALGNPLHFQSLLETSDLGTPAPLRRLLSLLILPGTGEGVVLELQMEWQMGSESLSQLPRIKPFICKIHMFLRGATSQKQKQEEAAVPDA